jgi:hypothetical protein
MDVATNRKWMLSKPVSSGKLKLGLGDQDHDHFG